MNELIEGVRRFQREVYPKHESLFEALAKGQQPSTLLITCSDSRIAPHLITHAAPGELFVIRNAGNLIPAYGAGASGEEATLEYAVSALGVADIIVCGHSGCGAMGGLLAPESLAGLPSVARWLEHARATREALNARHPELSDPEARLSLAVEINVLRQLDNLRTHPCVAAALTAGRIALHGWVYDIGSGRVRAYEPKAAAFVDLIEGAQG